MKSKLYLMFLRPSARLKKMIVGFAIFVITLTGFLLANPPAIATAFVNFKQTITVQYIPWPLTENQLNACEIGFGNADFLKLKFLVDQNQHETVFLQKNGQLVTQGWVTFDNDKPTLALNEWTIDQLYDMKNYQQINIYATNNTLKHQEHLTFSLSGLTSGLEVFEKCLQGIKPQS